MRRNRKMDIITKRACSRSISLSLSNEPEPTGSTVASVGIDEILFDEFKEAERLIIQTKNSTYTFSITEPIEHRGTLIGGVLDKNAVSAQLVGPDPDRLKTGSRAIFWIEA